ncbi:MAG: HAMP domain-containing protein [Gammaproteobacteria bacterium]|nr:HAMP domain-containing protein [Gammaproteobacteria bacterium]MBU1624600.1 HAMP domain-containing protein [Gammaproteobacteria bacterium]MBU1982444.1 HAMP domain-containing protein [Gammaproteobacteria bacterium]
MKYLVLFSSVIGVILLYLLSSASGNTDLHDRNYFTLLLLTGTLALGLLVQVIYQFWQLRKKLRDQVYGAKLTLRLAMFFSLIAVLPGMLVYAVSVQFLGKSIESWFDVRVEKALEGGLNLARSTLLNGLDELGRKGQFVALILADQSPSRHGETLARFISEGGAQEAAVFDKNGKLSAFASSKRTDRIESPSIEMLRQVREKGRYSQADALPDGRLILRVIVPIRASNNEGRVLQFAQPVAERLAADAETVQGVYGDYQQLSLSRVGLKRLYGITLTLSLLIVLLSAISAAFYLSSKLSAPLAALAAGTRAVAKGDFSSNYSVQSNDELGGLTALFNQMTSQLSAAKTLSEQQQQQVADAKAHLESVLGHLSSGVLVLDEHLLLRSANASAGQILGVASAELNGKNTRDLAEEHGLLRPFLHAIEQGIASSPQQVWQQQIERMSKEGDQVLLLRGTRLAGDANRGYVVVFDDITHLRQAERQAAWGEVARRLAHEIKNPLTPIQLSAERLQHKLADRLDEKDAQLLQRATQTIVSQVAAMKNMVSDFADYARAPAARLSPLDLHQLLNEILGLYEANSSPIQIKLEARQTTINGDATRLRQVVHNLLQNAHDALQQVTDRLITLSTSDDKNGMLRLSVADNGSGFPEQFLAKAFEPYTTTKARGTGLGLPIVKRIVEEHGGSITIQNQPQGGTCVSILLPVLEKKIGRAA